MSIAEDMIHNAAVYASFSLNAAISQLNNAMGMLSGIAKPPSGNGPPDFNITIPAPRDPGPAPAYTGRKFEGKPFTKVPPTLQRVDPLTLPPEPDALADPPTYDAPTQPTGEPDFSSVATIPAINYPDAPPDPPDLAGMIERIPPPVLFPINPPPPPPVYNPPAFAGTPPVFDTEMPTGLDDLMRDEYETIAPVMRAAVAAELDAFLDREFPQFRQGMAAVEARLAIYLAGGTALSPAIENAMYSRAIDKTNMDGVRASRKAYAEAAKRGHTLVSVAVTAQQIDLDQQRRDGNVRAAIDISIENAKMEQNNLQFAVTQSIGLRKIAIDAGMAYYAGLVQLNGQSIEYAKEVVDAVLKGYELAIKHAEIQCRIYEAEARIYEVLLKGSMQAIEAYVAYIKGLEAVANVNTAMVAAYTAQVRAVEAIASVYKSGVDALVAVASMEKLKIDLYQAQVQALTAQTAMYTARWQGYEAAVRGETSEQAAFAEQARAFQAEWSAWSENVRGRATAIDAQSKNNESLVHTYTAEVNAYGALVHAEAESVGAEITSFDSTLKAYTAEAAAQAEYDRALIAQSNAALQVLIQQVNLYLENIRHVDRQVASQHSGITTIATAAAQVYGNVAQSALSGMNSLAANVNNVSE